MKRVKVKIETSVETMLGDKPVNEFLSDVADICHTSLEYSTSKNEGCEKLYENGAKIIETTWQTGYLFLKVLFAVF